MWGNLARFLTHVQENDIVLDVRGPGGSPGGGFKGRKGAEPPLQASGPGQRPAKKFSS